MEGMQPAPLLLHSPLLDFFMQAPGQGDTLDSDQRPEGLLSERVTGPGSQGVAVANSLCASTLWCAFGLWPLKSQCLWESVATRFSPGGFESIPASQDALMPSTCAISSLPTTHPG